MYLGDLGQGSIFKIEGEPREYRIVEADNFTTEEVWGDMYPRILKSIIYATECVNHPEKIYKFHPEQPVVFIDG